MATTVDTTLFDTNPRARYPWAKWADGQAWYFVSGVDYVCSTSGFVDAAKKYARRHGFRVRRRGHPAGVYLQFVKREEATTYDTSSDAHPQDGRDLV